MAFIISYKTFFTFVPNKRILVAGIFLGAHFALFFRSVQLTSIAEAALLGTISPVFTEIYSILFQKKSFSPKVSLGLFLALFGALILISQSSFSSTSSLGNILAVFCSVAMAAVLLIGKEVRKSVGLLEYSRWIFLYASICLFFISLFQGVSVLKFNPESFVWFLFLAAVPTMVGHNIFYFLVKSLSATTVAAVPLGEPLISSVGAFFLFGEPVGLLVFLGGIITLLGVFFVIRYGD
jgi:drug/metabolite transporter (DMT)-like permease